MMDADNQQTPIDILSTHKTNLPFSDGKALIKNESKDDSISHEIELPSPQRFISPKLQLPGKLTWDNKDETNNNNNAFQELSGNLNVEVLAYEKVGEGMGAFVLFTIRTTTNIPVFKSNEMTIKRRFSDFLGLYQRLLQVHISKGILVPPPPEKQSIDSNKYKFVKDVTKENDFLEHRRIALLHFLENLVRHPALRTDPIFREFLEFEGNLPKATNTQTLSGSTATKFFKSVTDSFVKLTTTVDDSDEYFFEKAQELNTLERQFTRLMHSFNALASNQADTKLSTCVAASMEALDQLSTAEQDNPLAGKLKQLSSVYDTLARHEAVRAQAESVYLHDMARSIVAMIVSGKLLLEERRKLYRRWKETEDLLTAKRAQKVKLELTGKADMEKTNLIQAQVTLTSQKVDECKTEFEAMCRIMKQEFSRFDMHRFYDMRSSMLAYLEVLLSVQLKNQDAWTHFLQMIESGSV